MNDQELLTGFRRSRLDVFPHEDHLRVAHLLVREHGEARGAQEFIRGLRRLAYRFGALPFMLHMTRTKQDVEDAFTWSPTSLAAVAIEPAAAPLFP